MILLKWKKFYKTLSFDNKGKWTKHKHPDLRSFMFQTNNIVVAGNRDKPFIRSEELVWLVNLVRLAESIGGVRSTDYSRFDIQDIQRAVEASDAPEKLNELIPAIRNDLRHDNWVVPTNLETARRSNTPLIPPFRKENGADKGSRWILFLNDDYEGGKIWFPTRGLAMAPVAGCVVRFPTGIPYGRTSVRKGYQFTLEGENTPERAKAESWKGISELAEKGLIQ